MVILRQFTSNISLEISQIVALLDLLTTDGKGLSLIWRVYLKRVSDTEYEYIVKLKAQYQLLKKSQVFWALLTDPSIGKLLLGDTRGNIHVWNDYPWELSEDFNDDWENETIIIQNWAYYIHSHGTDKITSLSLMNNSKTDIISTAKQKHVKVLRYFVDKDKFEIISTLKPGPLSCVLGIYTTNNKVIVVGGRGVMMYLWNLLDKQQLFSINCKGWNRHISFDLVPNNLSKFFISFSNKNVLTVYYSNKMTKSMKNEWITIRSSLHQRETLTVVPIFNPFNNCVYLVTGGEDTEMLISIVKPDRLDLINSFNYHTSSIRVIRKILYFESSNEYKYYMVTAGGQMIVNLFDVIINESGIEILHLSKYEGLKSDQDFRIMDVDIKTNLDSKLLVFIASSSGQYHWIVHDQYNSKFETISTLEFDTSLLWIKAVQNKNEYACFIGTNKGKFIAIQQSFEQTENEEYLANVISINKPHQIGINVLDIQSKIICTGSDDQQLVVQKIDVENMNENLLTIQAQKYAHHSSIKALKMFSLIKDAQGKYYDIFENQDLSEEND